VSLFLALAVFPVGALILAALVSGGLSSDVLFNVDLRTLGLFVRSLQLAAGATLLALLFGLPLVFLLLRSDLAGRKFWLWLSVVPLCIPSYIQAVAWIQLLGSEGWINRWLASHTGLPVPAISIYGIGGSILVLAFSYFPFVVLLTMAGLANLDHRLEESASLSNNPRRVFRKITLPLLVPYIFSGAVFVFIFSLFNYGVPALLRVQTYPVEIFAQFSAFYNRNAATIQSLPLVGLAVVLLWIQRRVMGSRAYVTLDTGRRQTALFELGLCKLPAFTYVFGLLGFAVILPGVVLFVRAGTLQSFIAAWRTSAAAVLHSVGLSAAAATLILVISFLLAELIEERRCRWRSTIDYLTFLPFAFPATLVGIAMIFCWNQPWLEAVYASSLILVIAYCARFLPFTVRLVNSGIKQVGPSVREAAWLCEKSRWRRMASIDVPLTARSLAVGWMIGFILCMGELGATLLVVPPGSSTASLKIYSLMHYGANQVVAALSLTLVAVSLAICGLVWLLSKIVHRPARL